MNLTELANKYGTDKGTEGKNHERHGYTVTYERCFAHLKDKPIKLLEIGIADPRFPGASVRMWEEWFTQAQIIGVDILDCAHMNTDRITTIQLDAGDVDAIIRLGKEHGPFDIIIDDGSHNSSHHLIAYLNLYDYLAPHGYYWIEDCHVAPMTPMVLGYRKGAEIFHGGKLLGLCKDGSELVWS